MYFNSSSIFAGNIEPCVPGTWTCQNSTVPFFVYENTGNVNLTLDIVLDTDFPSVFNLKSTNTSNVSQAITVNTTIKTIAIGMEPNATLDQYFWGDFNNAYPSDSTNRTLISIGNQT